jgi:DNA-binding transcriptional regulator of glucitol operon
VASYRFAWRPRWVAGHVLVLAAVVAMIFLGRWQLMVSNRKHFSLQNFGYALQWWAFSLFAVGFWIKIVRDHALGRHVSAAEPTESHRPEPAPVPDDPVTYRRYVMPSATQSDDPEIERYNAYLASLADRDDS